MLGTFPFFQSSICDQLADQGAEVPVPGVEEGTRASGLSPVAGSVGFCGDMPGCWFSFVVGSAGIPAGDE